MRLRKTKESGDTFHFKFRAYKISPKFKKARKILSTLKYENVEADHGIRSQNKIKPEKMTRRC